MIDWSKMHHSKEEYETMAKIAKRAVKFYETLGHKINYQSTLMDLELTHHINKMNLQKLLQSDDHNFGHDMSGVFKFLNRETGELSDLFLPRCSQRD